MACGALTARCTQFSFYEGVSSDVITNNTVALKIQLQNGHGNAAINNDIMGELYFDYGASNNHVESNTVAGSSAVHYTLLSSTDDPLDGDVFSDYAACPGRLAPTRFICGATEWTDTPATGVQGPFFSNVYLQSDVNGDPSVCLNDPTDSDYCDCTAIVIECASSVAIPFLSTDPTSPNYPVAGPDQNEHNMLSGNVLSGSFLDGMSDMCYGGLIPSGWECGAAARLGSV